MSRKAGWAVTAGVIAAGALYQVLIYRAAHGALPHGFAMALKCVPLALFAWWGATHARYRALAFLALALAAFGLWWADGHSFGDAAYGIPHAVVYLSLAWVFGHTLAPGHVPLVTRLATAVHGELAPELVVHTRRVTWAWTLFSLAQVAMSACLYLFASLDAWSLFITVLNVPLLGLMFVIEYAVRVLCFPHHPQASIVQAIRAFAQHTAPAEPEGIHGSPR
ncbi:MAG TPA: hypothetical protein VGN52_08585 [Burkholderiales bacterium]